MSNILKLVVCALLSAGFGLGTLIAASALRFFQQGCRYAERWSRKTQDTCVAMLIGFWLLPAFYLAVQCCGVLLELCFEAKLPFWQWAFMVGVPSCTFCARLGLSSYKTLLRISNTVETWRLARLRRLCALKCQRCRELAKKPDNLARLLGECPNMGMECQEKFRHITFVMNEIRSPIAQQSKHELERKEFLNSHLASVLQKSGLMLTEAGADSWLDFSNEEREGLANALSEPAYTKVINFADVTRHQHAN